MALIEKIISLSTLLGPVELLCWDKAMLKHFFTFASYMDDLEILHQLDQN